MITSEQVKKARVLSEFSPKKCAEIIGVERRHWYKLESGEREITPGAAALFQIETGIIISAIS